MESFDNASPTHLVCKTTAARAVAKIHNGCRAFTIRLREEDHDQLKKDMEPFSTDVFTRQVTGRIAKLLTPTPEIRLESITTAMASGQLHLVCEVSS